MERVFDSAAIIDCNGVGYEVNASAATLAGLPRNGEPVTLWTHMQVSQEAIALYGFLSVEELQMFKLLLRVSGVGAKVAQSLLATLSPRQIMIAILTDDAAELAKAPGVGKKTAQRLALELRDRIKSKDSRVDAMLEAQQRISVSASSEKGDAVDALSALGYGRAEAVRAVAEVTEGAEGAEDGLTTEKIIRLALKKLSAR